MCTYSRLPDEGQATLNGEGQLDGHPTTDLRGTQQPGAWYSQMCQNPDGTRDVRTLYSPDGSPPSPGGSAPPDPRALAQQALQRVPLPSPSIAMSPGGDIPLLVNLPTFLWIEPAQWSPVTASASAGGVTSTVTATPERVVWDMGQGDSVTCNGPGAPYVPTLPDDAQPSDCSYTYRASSARSPDKTFTVTATVEWHVTWSASGAPGGGDLGTSRRASTTIVRVAEIQVLNAPAARS